MAYVVSTGMTGFGDRDESLGELMALAANHCIENSDVDRNGIDGLVASNALGGEMGMQTGVQNYLSSRLGINGYSRRVGQTSAGGAAAFKEGCSLVDSGKDDVVLVVGGEKMTHLGTSRSSDVISSVIHPDEYRHGLTMPAFAGLVADLYINETDATRKDLARVAVENHGKALRNPDAQFGKDLSEEDVLNSPLVADPLRLYDFCPTTDGAAAVLMVSDDRLREDLESGASHGVSRVAAVAGTNDTHAVHDRDTPLSLKAVRESRRDAYQEAGISTEDIDVLELHDMFTALELIQLEDLGFYNHGKGWRYVRREEDNGSSDGSSDGTTGDGDVPVINPSGGLKARGHPLAATGLAQIVELHRQITNEAGERTVNDASVGVACNLAGYGNAAITTVMDEPGVER
ncbi:MAG: thiolase family protein [Halobacteria archaeon]